MASNSHAAVGYPGDKPVMAYQFIKTLFLFLVLAGVYWHMFVDLIQAWNIKPQSSHGFFVLPIALWLCWQRKGLVKDIGIRRSGIGNVLLFWGLGIYLAGYLGSVSTMMNMSFMVSAAGIVIGMLGYSVLRVFLFPYLFLFFMFPIPDAIYVSLTNPLKLMVSDVSAFLIGVLGIAVYQDGNLIQIGNFQMEVVEACSGMRSLISYLMLGTILASFLNGSRWKIGLLAASAVPIAFLNNILRITITGLLAEWYGADAAEGFFHGFTGMITFAIGFLMLIGVYTFLSEPKSKTEI